jgi:hypothetical protein
MAISRGASIPTTTRLPDISKTVISTFSPILSFSPDLREITNMGTPSTSSNACDH